MMESTATPGPSSTPEASDIVFKTDQEPFADRVNYGPLKNNPGKNLIVDGRTFEDESGVPWAGDPIMCYSHEFLTLADSPSVLSAWIATE